MIYYLIHLLPVDVLSVLLLHTDWVLNKQMNNGVRYDIRVVFKIHPARLERAILIGWCTNKVLDLIAVQKSRGVYKGIRI